MKQIYTKHLRYLVPVAAMFAVAACAKDSLIDPTQKGNALRFEVSRSGGWNTPQQQMAGNGGAPMSVIALQGDTPDDTLFLHVSSAPSAMDGQASSQVVTRGVPVDESTIENFGVYGYTYTGEWDTASDRSLYVREEAEKARDWTLFTSWPGSKFNIRFFAYTPELHNFVFDENSQTIQCHIAPEAENQEDLLVARTEGMAGNANAPVPIGFSHAMTALKFVAGEDMKSGYIHKISISGVCGSGVYDFATNDWTSVEGSQTYTYEVPIGSMEMVGDSTNAPLTPLEATFMMLPQTLPEGATIEVIYFNAATNLIQHTLTASIAGTQWEKGQTVTYRLSTSSVVAVPDIAVEEWLEDFTYLGGTQEYSLHSYTYGTSVEGTASFPTRWIAEFSTDDGLTWTTQKPEWLTDFTCEDYGGAPYFKYTATVAPQQGVTSNPHDDALRTAAPVAGTYDLSTKGGTTAQNTANCYIINAPGRYQLPIVFGNAIKNGVENKAAYTRPAGVTATNDWFYSYEPSRMSTPYIIEDLPNRTISGAKLVWQDVKDLVTNISVSQDSKQLFFEVGASTIKQGNAVIAVLDGENKIMWSWHIWVTDYVPGLPATLVTDDGRDKVVTDYQNVQHTMMPINIGWCYDDSVEYPERSVKVRFVQTGVGNNAGTSEVYTITQSGYAPATLGRNTYYQWGRKDPMRPADKDGTLGMRTAFIKCYGDNGEVLADPTSTSSRPTLAGNVSFMTQNPETFVTAFLSPYYWNATSTTSSPIENVDARIKTIYDPSPVGYQVPNLYDFSFMVPADVDYDGGDYSSYHTHSTRFSEAPVAGSFDNGLYFYCDGKNRTGPCIFFPATGMIDIDTESGTSTPTIFWRNWHSYSLTNMVNRSGYRIYAYSHQQIVFSVCDLVLMTPYSAMPVRPVREQ